MQRIVAELCDVVLEGVVVDGMPTAESSAEPDLECEVTLRFGDGALDKASAGAADINALGTLR